MGKIDCHVAYSTNGWHFQRTVREPLIPNGPPGDPSSGCIYPSSMTEVGDTLRIYSSASKGEHAQFRADPSSGQGSILLHELRKDGFVYLEPAGGTGEFTTKWILWGGGEASINVDAPDGEILVQVTDHLGNRIEGYTYADCEAFHGDSIGWTPAWRDGKNLSALAGRVIKLGVRVANGRVYALRGDYPLHHHAASPQLHPKRQGAGADALLLRGLDKEPTVVVVGFNQLRCGMSSNLTVILSAAEESKHDWR